MTSVLLIMRFLQREVSAVGCPNSLPMRIYIPIFFILFIFCCALANETLLRVHVLVHEQRQIVGSEVKFWRLEQ